MHKVGITENDKEGSRRIGPGGGVLFQTFRWLTVGISEWRGKIRNLSKT